MCLSMLGESLDIKGEVPFHLHIVSTCAHRTEILRACMRHASMYVRDNVSFNTAQK